MPTLREILQEKEDRLESVPDALATRTEKAQRQILKQLIAELDSLDREDSKIKVTSKNLSKIQQIAERLSDFIFDKTDYSNALKAFAREFNTQAALSNSYMRLIENDFKDKEIYKANLQLSQKQTIELLAKSGVNQVFINPMKDILQASVTSGSTFSDAVSSLTEFVSGTDQKEGALLSHVKQVAYDGFAFSDANYLKLVTKDLNYEFFQYFGGSIADSRCFCVERANKIFHKKEIEHWGETPSLWDKKGACKHGGGRIPETNASTIWTFRGGYRCAHTIVPVAPTQVPKTVMDRARKAGYIN